MKQLVETQTLAIHIANLNDAATKINENFDNGTVDMNDLTCATTPPDPKEASAIKFGMTQ